MRAYIYGDTEDGDIKAFASEAGLELTNNGFNSRDDHVQAANEIAEMRRAQLMIVYLGFSKIKIGIGLLQSAYVNGMPIYAVRPESERESPLSENVKMFVGGEIHHFRDLGDLNSMFKDLENSLKPALLEAPQGAAKERA